MRTSIVLGTVALALLLFIVFVERGTVSTGEREQRRGRVLDRLVRDKLVRVQIQRRGVTLELWRGPDPENDLDLGAWQVGKPYAAKADAEVVDSLLGSLEWITPKRTLRDLAAGDLAQFGLHKPRYRVTLLVDREPLRFRVGGETPQHDGAYLQLDDDARSAYVVGKDVVEALDHAPEHFHTKELHDGVNVYSTQRLELRDALGERVVEKRGEDFWLSAPQTAIASEPVVRELVEAFDALRAMRFVGPKPLAEHGLLAPVFELRLRTKSYDVREKGKQQVSEVGLRVGAACAGHAGESYVQSGGGPVLCASDADLAKLRRPQDELRDARALTLDESTIHGVTIRAGKTELQLREEKDEVRYTLREGAQPRAEGVADAAALSDWYKALHGAVARSAAAVMAVPVRDGGLAAPALVARFERGAGKEAYEIRFARAEAGVVRASRQAEPLVWTFPESTLALFAPSAARLRALRLLREPQGELVRLSLERTGGASETVERVGEDFRLAAPAQAAASVSRARVEEVARLLSALEAVRFVADAPAPEHGLGAPQLRARADYAKGEHKRTHVLVLGAATDGGHFAQLDADAAVFVAPAALAKALQEPLAQPALPAPLD